MKIDTLIFSRKFFFLILALFVTVSFSCKKQTDKKKYLLVKSETNNASSPDFISYSYTYDSQGRVSLINYSDKFDKKKTVYSYSPTEIKETVEKKNSEGATTVVVTTYRLNLEGRVVNAFLPSGLVLNYVYDAEGYLSKAEGMNNSTKEVQVFEHYTYKNGSLISMKDTGYSILRFGISKQKLVDNFILPYQSVHQFGALKKYFGKQVTYLPENLGFDWDGGLVIANNYSYELDGNGNISLFNSSKNQGLDKKVTTWKNYYESN